MEDPWLHIHQLPLYCNYFWLCGTLYIPTTLQLCVFLCNCRHIHFLGIDVENCSSIVSFSPLPFLTFQLPIFRLRRRDNHLLAASWLPFSFILFWLRRWDCSLSRLRYGFLTPEFLAAIVRLFFIATSQLIPLAVIFTLRSCDGLWSRHRNSNLRIAVRSCDPTIYSFLFLSQCFHLNPWLGARGSDHAILLLSPLRNSALRLKVLLLDHALG